MAWDGAASASRPRSLSRVRPIARRSGTAHEAMCPRHQIGELQGLDLTDLRQPDPLLTRLSGVRRPHAQGGEDSGGAAGDLDRLTNLVESVAAQKLRPLQLLNNHRDQLIGEEVPPWEDGAV